MQPLCPTEVKTAIQLRACSTRGVTIQRTSKLISSENPISKYFNAKIPL